MLNIEVTCPSCRHIVSVEAGAKRKCPNCGDLVWSLPPASATPPTTPAAVPRPIAPPTEAPSPGATATFVTAPAFVDTARANTTVSSTATAALVCGLLFFIPGITQLLAIGLGLFAIAKRRDNQRVAAAWVGLLMGLVTLAGWVLMFSFATSLTPGVMRWAVPPPTTPTDDTAGERVAKLAGELERLGVKITAYRRDYRKWPPAMEALVGRYLPDAYVLPKEILFRPPVNPENTPGDWVVAYSVELLYDQDGERLSSPHRLVLRLSGRVDLVKREELPELTLPP